VAYAIFNNPSEHLAVDEVTLKFEAGLYSGRKENVSASKFPNTDDSGYTYDRVYLVETGTLPQAT
jgi:hypothetical protein